MAMYVRLADPKTSEDCLVFSYLHVGVPRLERLCVFWVSQVRSESLSGKPIGPSSSLSFPLFEFIASLGDFAQFNLCWCHTLENRIIAKWQWHLPLISALGKLKVVSSRLDNCMAKPLFKCHFRWQIDIFPGIVRKRLKSHMRKTSVVMCQSHERSKETKLWVAFTSLFAACWLFNFMQIDTFWRMTTKRMILG